MTTHPWAGGPVGSSPVLADPPEHRQPRRIVQITGNKRLFALCSDGTVWEYDPLGYDWIPVRPIPQRQLAEA